MAGCEKAYLYYSSLKKHIRLSHPTVFHEKIASNQSRSNIAFATKRLNFSMFVNRGITLYVVTMNDCLAPDSTKAGELTDGNKLRNLKAALKAKANEESKEDGTLSDYDNEEEEGEQQIEEDIDEDKSEESKKSSEILPPSVKKEDSPSKRERPVGTKRPPSEPLSKVPLLI